MGNVHWAGAPWCQHWACTQLTSMVATIAMNQTEVNWRDQKSTQITLWNFELQNKHVNRTNDPLCSGHLRIYVYIYVYVYVCVCLCGWLPIPVDQPAFHDHLSITGVIIILAHRSISYSVRFMLCCRDFRQFKYSALDHYWRLRWSNNLLHYHFVVLLRLFE